MICWDHYSSADYRGLDGWEDTCHEWPGQKQLGCSEAPMLHLNSMCSRKRAKVSEKSMHWIFMNNMPCNKTKSSGTRTLGCDHCGCTLDDQIGRMRVAWVKTAWLLRSTNVTASHSTIAIIIHSCSSAPSISMHSRKWARVGKKLLSWIFVNNMPCNKTMSSGMWASGCDHHGCVLDDQIGRMDFLDVENGWKAVILSRATNQWYRRENLWDIKPLDKVIHGMEFVVVDLQ